MPQHSAKPENVGHNVGNTRRKSTFLALNTSPACVLASNPFFSRANVYLPTSTNEILQVSYAGTCSLAFSVMARGVSPSWVEKIVRDGAFAVYRACRQSITNTLRNARPKAIAAEKSGIAAADDENVCFIFIDHGMVF